MGHSPSIGRVGLSAAIVVFALIASLGTAQAADPGLDATVAATACPERVGHWPYGPSEAVAIDGDTAFFGVGTVLRVADVSSPTEPVVLSEVRLGDVILDMAISGDLLIAAVSGSGVAAVDISDPVNPVLLDTLFLDGTASAVAVADGHAFIGGYSLWVVDLSSPSNMILTGELEDLYIRDLAVSGNLAVLAASGAFYTVNISNPSSPTLLGTHTDDLDRPVSVDVSGDHAYLMEMHDDIVVLDISNPNNPSIVNRIDPDSGQYTRLHVNADRLYLGREYSSEFWIYGLGDPATPVELWNGSVGFGSNFDFATDGTTLFSARGSDGLGIIDVTMPTAPESLGGSNAESSTRLVELWDSYAVTVLGSRRLVIFDMSDPAHPVELSRLSGVNPNDIVVRDGYAFVVGGSASGLSIIEMTDPTAPVITATIDAPGSHVALTGDLAVIGGSSSDVLRVIDIGDPYAPVEVATVDADYANRVAASGPAVYVPENNAGLHIFDVTVPSTPVEVGFIAMPDIGNNAMAAGDGLLAVDDRGNGIRIYDLSNPLQPIETAFYTGLTRYSSFSISDHFLLVGGVYADRGLHVLDLSDPTDPVHLGDAPLIWSFPTDTAALGGLALVAEEDAGFEIFDFGACALGTVAADFGWTPAQPWIGLTVEFTDASGGGVTAWSWTFGDGGTSTESDPSHIYTSAGSYSVELSVTGPTGTDSVSKSITVAQDPPETPPIEEAGSRQWILPAAAHSPGAHGTNWVSDVVIHNIGSQTASVNVYFLKAAQSNSGAIGRLIEIPGGTSIALDDIVLDRFGWSNASGAILIGSETTLRIASRTYNDASSGTYGQFIPGLSVAAAAATGEEVRLIQLTRGDTFRTNIGWANPGATSVNLAIDLVNAQGASIGSHQALIPPFGYGQANDILPGNVDDAMAVVSSNTPGAKFFVYASVVDNSTGDPILILESDSATDLYIPASAHVQGLAGTDWRTDLEIANSNAQAVQCTIDLLKTGFDNSTPKFAIVSVPANGNVRVRDVLDAMLDHDGSAALRLRSDGRKISATSSTYNNTADGTYGQFISGTISDKAVVPTRSGMMIQLSQSAGNTDGYRTNLGLLNTTGIQVEVVIELFDSDGTSLGSGSTVLMPFEHRQINRIFREVTSAAVTNGVAKVSTTTPKGAFLAYASVVDNRSGDPVYIPAWVK